MKKTTKTVYLEKALLIGVVTSSNKSEFENTLAELEQLTKTAGAVVSDVVIQRRDVPDTTFYIGRGKVDEIKNAVEGNDIDVVIFDNELSPAQIRNLENAIKVKVIDRTELILDIFATHARSRQAKLQVELAQLEYTLPRLKHMWTHLSRIEGGIGQRGPGETQLEMDRRLARDKITKIKREIEVINQRRQRDVENRSEYFNISLIGYTNAGKSTLMNALTGTDCLVEDKLFSTLDTKTNLWSIGKYKLLLSDTVGFIRNLPHNLIASFHATLQEVINADLLFHVVDVSQPNPSEHIKAVDKVLDELGCKGKDRLLLFNKIDEAEPLELQIISKEYPDALLISAKENIGLDNLTKIITEIIEEKEIEAVFSIPAGDGKTRAYLAEHGRITKETYTGNKARIKIKLSPAAHSRVIHYMETIKGK